MARQTFQETLGAAPTPAAADPSAAIAAINTRTQGDLNLFNFALQQGVSAVQAFKEEKVKKRINEEVIDVLANPVTGFEGRAVPGIRKSEADIADKLAVEQTLFGGILEREGAAGPITPEVDKELASIRQNMDAIKNAERQKIISPAEARARIMAIVRQESASMPGLSGLVKKAAASITGIEDVEQSMVKAALTAEPSESALAKQQAEDEKDFLEKAERDLNIDRITGRALLNNPETRDLFIRKVQGRGAELQANTLMEETTKRLEFGSREEVEALNNAARGATGVMYNNIITDLDLIKKTANINVNEFLDSNGRLKLDAPTDKLNTIMQSVEQIKNKINTHFGNQIALVQASSRTIRSGELDGMVKRLTEERDRALKFVEDQAGTNGLNLFKRLTDDEKATTEIRLRRVETASALKSVIGQQIFDDLSDPRLRVAVARQYPAYAALHQDVMNGALAGVQAMTRVDNYTKSIEDGTNPNPRAPVEGIEPTLQAEALRRVYKDAAGIATSNTPTTPADKNIFSEFLTNAPLSDGNRAAIVTALDKGRYDEIMGEDSAESLAMLERRAAAEASYSTNKRLQDELKGATSGGSGEGFWQIKVGDGGEVIAEVAQPDGSTRTYKGLEAIRDGLGRFQPARRAAESINEVIEKNVKPMRRFHDTIKKFTNRNNFPSSGRVDNEFGKQRIAAIEGSVPSSFAVEKNLDVAVNGPAPTPEQAKEIKKRNIAELEKELARKDLSPAIRQILEAELDKEMAE